VKVTLPDIAAADLQSFRRLLPALHYDWLRDNWTRHYGDDEVRWVRVDPSGFEAFLDEKALPRNLTSLLTYAERLANRQ
jgi:hypothetical protein